jgi:serine/threonine protein phosphatase PrpC
MVSVDEIQRLLVHSDSLRGIVDNLVGAAKSNGGLDNISLVVLRASAD